MRVTGGFGVLLAALASALAVTACGTASGKVSSAAAIHPRHSVRPTPPARPGPRPTPSPAPAATHPAPAPALPAPGNPSGRAYLPVAARPVSTSHPTHVIGNGTPASCTSAAVVAAVAAGASSPSPAARPR